KNDQERRRFDSGEEKRAHSSMVLQECPVSQALKSSHQGGIWRVVGVPLAFKPWTMRRSFECSPLFDRSHWSPRKFPEPSLRCQMILDFNSYFVPSYSKEIST